MLNIPASTKVLVLGGGPAGSTAASFLARAGVEVTLIEREMFPRYHIGESLLPSCLEIADLVGARQKIEAKGFVKKPGAYLEWGREKWSLDFGELQGQHTYSFQVDRSEFDELLLRHSEEQGVRVFEGVEVKSIENNAEGRPVKAVWAVHGDESQTGEISFDYLIDASGRHGVMSTRYLHNRQFHKVFQNIAVWGYWEGTQKGADYRDGAIAVGSIPDGWIWAIPMSGGKTSVGVVVHKDSFQAQKREADTAKIYEDAIASCPLIQRVCSGAKLVTGLKTESDYSYAAESFCGPGYFLCGDAACFLDPLLSTGVHLAMLSAMLSAAAITSVVSGEVSEQEAQSFFEKSYRQAYLRFLVFVSVFYDQRCGKDNYFKEAERLSQYESDPSRLKQAFLNLVSGLEDLSSAEQATNHLIGEMSRRVAENLTLRKDKSTLASGSEEIKGRAQDNARFFDGVEGIPVMSPEGAIDGLYVVLKPRFGLGRFVATVEASSIVDIKKEEVRL